MLRNQQRSVNGDDYDYVNILEGGWAFPPFDVFNTITIHVI